MPPWHTFPRPALWFPRIELAGSAGNPVFQLRIRKAPALHHTIRLHHSHFADFRKMPRRKGPDLAKCIAMRRNILPAGAEEALITTAQGFILEGLTTTILWWENGTLCHVPPSCRILPGITGQLILRIAGQNGIPVAARMRKPHELNRREVWAVNALHGIRRVINWERTPFQTRSALRHRILAQCTGKISGNPALQSRSRQPSSPRSESIRTVWRHESGYLHRLRRYVQTYLSDCLQS